MLGKKLFNYVKRITTDSENNINVVDWFADDDRGRIVSKDRNCRKRFVYTGSTFFNTQESPFNPEDIVVTSRDTTIFSDCRNNALHPLNAKGELLGLQITSNMNVLYLHSLSIDNKGFLFIGFSIKKDALRYIL